MALLRTLLEVKLIYIGYNESETQENRGTVHARDPKTSTKCATEKQDTRTTREEGKGQSIWCYSVVADPEVAKAREPAL